MGIVDEIKVGLTQEQVTEIITQWRVSMNYMIIGIVAFFLGIVVLAFIIWAQEQSRFRNIKEYIFNTESAKKDKDHHGQFEDDLNNVFDEVKTMADNTNLKFFKSMTNDLVRLKAYLLKYWIE